MGPPTWETCVPGMYNAMHADVMLKRIAERDTIWHMLKFRWMTALLDNCRIVVQRISPLVPQYPDLAFFALGTRHDSATVVWPCHKSWLGGKLWWTPTRVDAANPMVWVVVTDPRDWVAWRIRWRGPRWQYRNCPGARRFAGSFRAVRAFPLSEEPQPLIVISADEAFDLIPANILKKCCTHYGVKLAKDARLFRILFELIKKLLGCTDAVALEIAMKRITHISAAARGSQQELAGMEDGKTLLGRDEKEYVNKEQKRQHDLEEELDEYTDDWVLERKRQEPTIGRTRVTKLQIPAGHIYQEGANALKPPGCGIWRDNDLVEGGWAGHCPPYARCSSTVAATGTDRAALIDVLRVL